MGEQNPEADTWFSRSRFSPEGIRTLRRQCGTYVKRVGHFYTARIIDRIDITSYAACPSGPIQSVPTAQASRYSGIRTLPDSLLHLGLDEQCFGQRFDSGKEASLFDQAK